MIVSKWMDALDAELTTLGGNGASALDPTFDVKNPTWPNAYILCYKES